MAMCSHCGKDARGDEQFCLYCGSDLLASDEAQPYAASGAPLSWNSSQPQMVDPTGAANGSTGTASVPQARLMVRPSPTAEPGAVVDDGEREFLLDGRDIAVGRAPSCDIVLTGDQLASRRHALLRLRDNTYTVVDLGSSNGTYVNDEEIHAETPLNDGDRVTVGGHDLVFSTAPASPNASVAGMQSEPQQGATLLETAPVAIVNVPPAAPAPNAWQPQQVDAPLAEPEQLDEADEPVEAEESADVEDGIEAGDVASDEAPAEATVAAEPMADEVPAEASISKMETAYFVATPAESAPEAEESAAAATSEYDAGSVEEYDAGSADAYQASTEAAPAEAAPSSTSSDAASAAYTAGNSEAEDLDALRTRLAEIGTALSRKADEESKLASRLRAALVEVRDQLASLAREHGGGSYTSSEATQDYSQLANIARQAADHPRHLDYLSSLSDSAGQIADALEAKQGSTGSDGDDTDLLAGIDALRARLDETLG